MKFSFVILFQALIILLLQRHGTSFVVRNVQKPSLFEFSGSILRGWVQGSNGEWEWEEDDPNFSSPAISTSKDPSPSVLVENFITSEIESTATPTLPKGSFKPKQSLGQNFLRDGNTVAKIIKYYVADATKSITENDSSDSMRAIELGPGAGALTDVLVRKMEELDASFQCIEIDSRSVELLGEKHPSLRVSHMDVMQADYPLISENEGGPLSIIGNLPYYITSQILFSLADASHSNAVRSATVTMQYEVGERIVAKTSTKQYGILSVVFQLYADCKLHFKIPPTVFYPQPKVDSALLGFHFIGPNQLRKRLGGVRPMDLRRVLTATFQQRRKTVRNSLKKLVLDLNGGDKEKAQITLDSAPLPLTQDTLEAIEIGDKFAASQKLPVDWAKKRPEELSAGQFVELTRLVFNGNKLSNEYNGELGKKVWRKLKHGN